MAEGKTIAMGFTVVPYPLRAQGISVRYLPIIRHLSGIATIDSILIVAGAANENIDALRNYCRDISVIPDPRWSHHSFFSKLSTYANFLLPWTPPLTFVAHEGNRVTRRIVDTWSRHHYDALIWVGSYLSPNLVSALPLISADKVIVDFVDSPSLWASRAKDPFVPMQILDSYERWKIPRWEKKIVEGVDAAIYISRVDAESVRGIRRADKTHIVPNGVNDDSCTNGNKALTRSPNIGFLGNMGYPPNVEAVHWLYENVFLPIRSEIPELSLIVIGKDPVESVATLGSEPGVLVTGTVEDIWPYVNSVDVFVFPLRSGAGLKNKILEAMGAGRPVITTAIGNEGVDAVDGKDISIRETPEEFRTEAVRLLRSVDLQRAMGESARLFVRDRFSWDRILPRYEEIVIGSAYRRQTGRVPS